jgi:autotransporter-associated beta strand protein
MSAGTLIAEKLTLVNPTALTNAHATLILAGSAESTLALVASRAMSLFQHQLHFDSERGTIGAKADYSIVGNGSLSGTFTVKAADPGNLPFNITNTTVWSGSGNLVKSGAGVLTLNSNNTYSGTTVIIEGTLASVPRAPSRTVLHHAGEWRYVRRLRGQPRLHVEQLPHVAGFGTVAGNVTNNSGSIINPW